MPHNSDPHPILPSCFPFLLLPSPGVMCQLPALLVSCSHAPVEGSAPIAEKRLVRWWCLQRAASVEVPPSNGAFSTNLEEVPHWISSRALPFSCLGQASDSAASSSTYPSSLEDCLDNIDCTVVVDYQVTSSPFSPSSPPALVSEAVHGATCITPDNLQTRTECLVSRPVLKRDFLSDEPYGIALLRPPGAAKRQSSETTKSASTGGSSDLSECEDWDIRGASFDRQPWEPELSFFSYRFCDIVEFGKMVHTVINKPTRIENGRIKCLILDAPTNDNLESYIAEMKGYGVTDLVRTCEPTYDDRVVQSAGIRVHEIIFPDGEAPPNNVVDDWLEVINEVGAAKGATAVHCVAGLGRAPVLVAVALIERGMDPLDAIVYIRERRKGAINRRQLQYLKNYKRRQGPKNCCIRGCPIM
eukprot:GHVT01032839.1.p1 GENE.GHVT01032839.1~~GHVT01032839.1.p1  ORF type:complete len:415 (+),score=22.27 GHVT01032839.1:1858-3102(+)